MSRNSGKLYPFPSDLVPPKVKEDKYEWGLPLAKAIYYNSQSTGSALFYNDRDLHRIYVEYALGKQSEEFYHPVLGINSNNIKESQLANIRWNIRNYATKRINSAVSKIMEQEYDPVVNAVDEMAVDFRKDYVARVKVYVKFKEWLDEKSNLLGGGFIPENIDPENIPQNDEEIEIHAQSNFKLRSEMEIEEGISYHLSRNNYDMNVRDKIVWDCFVFGMMSLLVDVDEYNNPLIDRISPQDMLVPYSEEPDFSNINYAGHIERMTVAELRRMAGDEFSKDEYEDIQENHTSTTDREREMSESYDSDYVNDYRDVRKIKVVRFEYLTQDELTNVKYDDKYGNERFPQMRWGYYRDKKGRSQDDKFKAKFKDKKELVRTPYTSVYSGFWIVGSDYVFKYGLKQSQERRTGALGDSLLGYKLYAPNMYSGEVVSTVKQMVPILDNLQDYHLKLQQIVSSSVPKGIDIDLYQLSRAKFVGANKKDLTDMQKLELYFQRGIVLRSSGGKQKPGADDRPVRELENGMARDAMNYLNLMQQALSDLDEITGINRVMAGGNLHEKTGKAVAQLQESGGVTALDYLYKADRYIFKEMCKSLGVLHVQAIKHGDKTHYERIFGKASTTFLAEDNGVDKHDFGFDIENRPSNEEWVLFYQDIAKASQAGQIGIDDEIVVKRINNLKKAQMYLRYAVSKAKRDAQREKQQDIQLNGKVQQESNNLAHQNSMELEDRKERNLKVKGDEDRKSIKLKVAEETKKELLLMGQKGADRMAEVEATNSSKEAMKIVELESKENESDKRNI